MKALFGISILFISSSLFGQRESFNNIGVPEDSIFGLTEQSSRVLELEKVIEAAQTFITEREDEVELLAIVASSEEPVTIENGQWPENVKRSINIIRNKTGSPIYHAEYPSSESGDWFIGYRYYFNEETGRVMAFQRMANFFNSLCAEIANEMSTYYFSEEGELIAKSYSLMNNASEDLTGKQCYFNYDHQYQIASTTKDLIR